MLHKLLTILFSLALSGLLIAGCASTAQNANQPAQTVGELDLKWPPFGEPVDDSPILQWQSFPGAAQYQVWVLDSGSAKVMVDQVTSNTQLPVAPPLQKGAGYNWTVQAQDANKTVFAELNSQFMVKASLELLEPIDGAKVGVSPTLRWAGFPGATRYQVLVIDSDAYPPEVVIDQTTTGTRWVVATPLIPGIG